jgi:hypothetical protein
VKPITTSPPKQCFFDLRKRINSLNQSTFFCGAVSGLFVSPPSNPIEAFTATVVGHHYLVLFRDRAGLHHGMFRNWGGLLSSLFQIARDFGGRRFAQWCFEGFLVMVVWIFPFQGDLLNVLTTTLRKLGLFLSQVKYTSIPPAQI